MREYESDMKTAARLTVDNNRCFACGTENEAGLKLRFSYGDDGGSAETRFVADAAYQGWRGLVHGGILMTLMDETMAKAAVRGGLRVVTAAMTVKFKRPARIGAALICSANVENVRKRIVYARSVIRSEDGTVLAEAAGKLMIT